MSLSHFLFLSWYLSLSLSVFLFLLLGSSLFLAVLSLLILLLIRSVPGPLSILRSLPVSTFFLFLPFPVLADFCYFFSNFVCVPVPVYVILPVLFYVLVRVCVSLFVHIFRIDSVPTSLLVFPTLFMFLFIVLICSCTCFC